MTPQQVADELEGMEPMHIKNELLKALRRQHQPRLVHGGFYLRSICYAWKTRQERAGKGVSPLLVSFVAMVGKKA